MAFSMACIELRSNGLMSTTRASGTWKVASCCNGVGALHTAAFLQLLGCTVVPLYDNPSGIFEREPEPLPENLKRLSETQVREQCDIG